jgi:hypothetical protein
MQVGHAVLSQVHLHIIVIRNHICGIGLLLLLLLGVFVILLYFCTTTATSTNRRYCPAVCPWACCCPFSIFKLCSCICSSIFTSCLLHKLDLSIQQ